MDNGQIILFQTQEDGTKVEVRFADETVGLAVDDLAQIQTAY